MNAREKIEALTRYEAYSPHSLRKSDSGKYILRADALAAMEPFEKAKAIRRGEVELPMYEELTGWIQRAPQTWLPALLAQVVTCCVVGKVFKDFANMMMFIDRAADGAGKPEAVLRATPALAAMESGEGTVPHALTRKQEAAMERLAAMADPNQCWDLSQADTDALSEIRQLVRNQQIAIATLEHLSLPSPSAPRGGEEERPMNYYDFDPGGDARSL